MLNLFTLVLMIFTFFSGLFWIIKYFGKGEYICVFLKYNLKKFLPTCFANVSIFEEIRILFFLKRMFFYCISAIIDLYASIFPMLFCIFMIRSFIFEPFQIPSGSMMPTLLSGDFILVNKFCYGIKNPITQNTLVEIYHPQRGDIVVFKYPLNTKLDYIKRVVGLPGDRVIYNSLSKTLIIYPNYSVSNHMSKSLSITYRNILPSNFVQTFSIDHGEVISNFYNIDSNKKMKNSIRLIQSEECFEGVMHHILTITEPSMCTFSMNMTYNHIKTNEYISEWIVPFGEYFMLGDNRDNSADSRYWGFVPERNIVGKAVVIWISLDKQQDKNWLNIIRFQRIGRIY